MNRLWLFSLLILVSSAAYGLEITRYVAQDATGDGLTKETPTGDLKKVLDLSANVDGLTIYIEPGTYVLPTLTDVNRRPRYDNVSIYGGGCDKVMDVPNKSIIKGDLFINGGVVINVDFRASVYGSKGSPESIEGSLHVIGCNIMFTKTNNLIAEAVGGQCMWLIGVDAQTASISSYRNGMSLAKVSAWGCNFSNGNGAWIGGVQLTATHCTFNDNSGAPGLSLKVEPGSIIRDCQIVGNKGYGGIKLEGLSDNHVVMFDRCVISNNVTTAHNYSSAITTYTPFFMRSCLVANNYAEVKGHGYGYEADHYKGAILLTRCQTEFLNCTFYGNREALIQYKMEAGDHHRIRSAQFSNCVFLKNQIPFLTKTGLEPKISHSAADFGSDIPELDAERNMKRITADSSGMVINDGISVRLLAGSPLINAGLSTCNLDINGNSHQLLGATDLGCCEYTGEWEKSTPETSLDYYGDKYVRVQTRYNDTDYYAMVPDSQLDGDKVISLAKSIYEGNKLLPVKKVEDCAAVGYMRVDDMNLALVYQLEYSPWGNWDIWTLQAAKEYKNVAPIAEYVNKKWVFKEVKPKPATTTRKSTTQARTPQKRTAARPAGKR
ncbi:MAG: right-handed parallel beta-helix repeat-containing protein [Muribaculaceae bacterium]|nr:right-handed parallel beta-helix repeat-containing protein [Muribaculaceae bacterium]